MPKPAPNRAHLALARDAAVDLQKGAGFPPALFGPITPKTKWPEYGDE